MEKNASFKSLEIGRTWGRRRRTQLRASDLVLHSLARRVASYLKIECYLISNIASVGLNFLRVRLVKVNREYIQPTTCSCCTSTISYLKTTSHTRSEFISFLFCFMYTSIQVTTFVVEHNFFLLCPKVGQYAGRFYSGTNHRSAHLLLTQLT